MDQLFQILFSLGGFQGTLLAAFLFSIKVNKISNRLLGLLTLFWGIFLFSFAFQSEGMYLRFPHLLKTFYHLLFAFSPLLYLQIKYLLGNYKKFNFSDLIHFLPLAISILLHMHFYLLSGEEKIFMIRNKTPYYEILQIIGDEVIAIQGIIYSILALRLLASYKKNIIYYQSNIDKRIIKITSFGVSLVLISWVIGIVGIHLDYLQIDTGIYLFIAAYLVLVLVIYVISYSAIWSPEIYKLDTNQIKPHSPKNQLHVQGNSDTIVNKQNFSDDHLHAGSDHMDEEDSILNDKLISCMEAEKPYLNPEISLSELADKIGVTRNQLSGIINQNHQVNFYEFINHYRILEVKRLMADPANKNLKLISLAYDAGFNSKASFNRIFKQMTEMTPSQYYSLQQVN